jgi:phenylalanyl-tRNA synthetase beta subunit
VCVCVCVCVLRLRFTVPLKFAQSTYVHTHTQPAEGDTLVVEVPPTRPDVLHECDIWEDAAISYGFNRIQWTVPKVCE